METKYIYSFSGGKDSTVGLYLAIKNNYIIDEVICNLMPFEEKDMYDHINNVDNYYFLKTGKHIVFIKNNKSIEEFMCQRTKRGKHKGTIRGFPLAYAGFCWISRDWKIVPLQKWQKQYEKKNNCKCHVYKGFATDEKNPKRKSKVDEYRKYPEHYKKTNKESYPLVDFNMTEEDCRSWLKNNNLGCDTHFKYNRSGCWFCQKSSIKARLKAIKEHPERLNKIREWCELSDREIYPDLTLGEINKYINK